jgi:hypothetical protein
MSADILVSRLEGVRSRGLGRWLARCPAHDDSSPSLSVLEKDDGRVLLHCFSGCSVEEILLATGLEFDALFPPIPIEHAPCERRPFPAADVLQALADESLLVAVAGENIGQGIELSESDRARCTLAAERIQAARSLALGNGVTHGRKR